MKLRKPDPSDAATMLAAGSFLGGLFMVAIWLPLALLLFGLVLVCGLAAFALADGDGVRGRGRPIE